MFEAVTRSVPSMNTRQWRIYFCLLTLGTAIVTLFGIWWFQPSHIAHNFSGSWWILDLLIFVTVTYIVWYQVVNDLFSWFIAGFMKQPVYVPPQKNLRVAFLTAFVPGSEPLDMLERTLEAMVRTDYPHETWLLDEGNDPEAKRICSLLGVRHFTRKGMDRYNTPEGQYKRKSKGGNYNSWFDQHGSTYDIVAQIDMDFVPKHNYLMRVLGYFRDPRVAFVGTPQIYGNVRKSWIARGSAEQAYNFYGSMQKGFYGVGMQLFIGANHALRVTAHDDIDGYSGHIVEDHLTGMKFYAKRWKSVYVPETLAVGEGPTTWSAYFSQQMRWAYGLIDILFHHSPKIFPRMNFSHMVNYFLLQQYYFFGLTQVLAIGLLCLYFFFGIQSTPMRLTELLIVYTPVLLFEQIFFIWLQQFNIEPNNEHGFMWHAKLLNWAVWPIYFLALFSVIFGKRLTYVVTKKGENTSVIHELPVFLPHFILGSLSAACLVASFIYGRHAPLLSFWAALNTIVMFGFVSYELNKLVAHRVGLVHTLLRPLVPAIQRVSLVFLACIIAGEMGIYIGWRQQQPVQIISPIPIALLDHTR